MDTICRDCVFAEWDGETQNGCEFGRIDKFDERGVEIEGEEDEATGKKYFRILGRFCNTCRSASAPSLDGKPSRKWAEIVRNEVKVRISMCVYVGPDDDADDAMATIDSIYAQYEPPYEIVVIRNRTKAGESVFSNRMAYEGRGIPWRVQNVQGVMRPDNTYDPEPTFGDAVDAAVANCQATFYTVSKAGYTYSAHYIRTIDMAINDELMAFIAIRPDQDGNAGLVQSDIHRTLKGNRQMFGMEDIYAKLEDIASQEGTEHMIKSWEELFRC